MAHIQRPESGGNPAVTADADDIKALPTIATLEYVVQVVPHSATEGLSEEDKKIAKKLLWKVDLWILPTLAIVYLLAAMDRSDIGNAQIAGMQKTIGASDSEWANVTAMFYLGFIVAQPVGNLALRKLTPPIVIGSAVLLWGTCVTCLMTARTVVQAIVLRVFIGVGEGIVHAAAIYLSLWYTPKELATRGAIYYSTSTVAGAFNGLIANGLVVNYANKPPFAPWQWLFLVEGLLSVGFGILVMATLPSVPEKLKWGFTADEKRLAIIRTMRANNTPGAGIYWSLIPSFLMQPMFYLWTLILCSSQIALTGLSSFLPAIISGMGFSSTQAQLMTVPVYSCAFVSTIAFGFLSDRTEKRGPWIVLLSLVSIVGYILLITVQTNSVRYAGVCIAALGQYALLPILLTWVAVNLRNFTERAVTTAVINMVAQATAIGALQGFNTPPYYIKGLSIVLGVVCLQPICAGLASWWSLRENRKKMAVAMDQETNEKRKMSLEELGSRHPDFYYSI